MWKKKLTLLIIPDSMTESRQLSVKFGTLWMLSGGLVLMILASFYFAGSFVTTQVAESDVERLQAENQLLKEKYEKIRWNLSEADSRYQDLVKKEIAIRAMFDLPEINPEERQLGIGGPGSPKYASMTETEKLAFATELEVDRLLRLSGFEIEKYSEVEKELDGVKSRLSHTPSIWPAKGWNSRGYGQKYDPFTGYKQMHRGIDIANHRGTPIIATAAGQVKSVGNNGGLGKMIVVDHGYGYVTRYGHLSQIDVKRGQKVGRGEVIGRMGSTGYSTGPHLHYEVWRNGQALDPREFILNEMN
jgi:murein DD-endopeptidase MepM/ murein hydrolase activator NlpD